MKELLEALDDLELKTNKMLEVLDDLELETNKILERSKKMLEQLEADFIEIIGDEKK